MSDSPAGDGPIGVLGGTFDPIHIGHLRVAIEVYETLAFSEVRLIPLAAPNHRPPPIAAGAARLEMLQGACDGRKLVADDRELVRGGVSFMVETLASLREEFERRPLCLLMGEDAFAGLCGWHRWRELLDFAHLLVVTRPGASVELEPRLRSLADQAVTTDPDIIHAEINGRIFFLPIPLLPISSTDIRARIATGRDISYLVPPSAQQLIDRLRLYR